MPTGVPAAHDTSRGRQAAAKRLRLATTRQEALFAADLLEREEMASWVAPGDPVDAFLAWCDESLKVPTGPLQSRPFAIDHWQEAFLRDALRPGVYEAGLSVARKNGKSGLIAALLLAHLVGPLASPGWRGVVVSLTGVLAKELRTAMAATAKVSGLMGIVPFETPPPGRMTGLRGTTVDFLAADKATGHAIGADLAVIDEAGLLQENLRGLWNAVMTSISGRNGRLVCISIRGDGPMFTELAERHGEPGVVWHEYAAPAEASLDDESAWAMANPALRSGVKSLQYMRHQAARALASPANAPHFLAYDLNRPQAPDREMILSVSQYLECAVAAAELPPRRGPAIIGLDMGGSTSMTAAAVIWPDTGRVEVRGAFPAAPGLAARGEADGVGGLYVRMAERGELRVYPGRVIDVKLFLADLADDLEDSEVRAAGADRYRREEVQDAMALAGLRWRMHWRGQGASATADGSADVRAFQNLVLRGRLKYVRNLVLENAISWSAISRDAAGNPKIDKAKSRGRIDALSAAVIAAGIAERYLARASRGAGVYHGVVG